MFFVQSLFFPLPHLVFKINKPVTDLRLPCSPVCSRGHYTRRPIQNTNVPLAYNKRAGWFYPLIPSNALTASFTSASSHSHAVRAQLCCRPCMKQT